MAWLPIPRWQRLQLSIPGILNVHHTGITSLIVQYARDLCRQHASAGVPDDDPALISRLLAVDGLSEDYVTDELAGNLCVRAAAGLANADSFAATGTTSTTHVSWQSERR